MVDRELSTSGITEYQPRPTGENARLISFIHDSDYEQ